MYSNGINIMKNQTETGNFIDSKLNGAGIITDY